VLRRRAADVVNIKLAKTGGLREAARLLAVAQACDIGVLVDRMMKSRVGISAAATFVASAGAATGVARAWGARVCDTVHDLDAGLWTDAGAVRGGALYDGAQIICSARAGLGITGVASEKIFETDS
jgi:L-alanine-DL-glutamate epimerase-like enolase superfamily enzyme